MTSFRLKHTERAAIPSDFSEEDLMVIRANAIHIYAKAKKMYEEGTVHRIETLDSDLVPSLSIVNHSYADIISKALPETFCHYGFSTSYLGDPLENKMSIYFYPPYDKTIMLPNEDEFVTAVNNLDINNLSTPALDFARGRSLIHMSSADVASYKEDLLNPFGNKNWAHCVGTYDQRAEDTTPRIPS